MALVAAGMPPAVPVERLRVDPSVTAKKLEDAVTTFMDEAKNNDLCGMCQDLSCGMSWNSRPTKSVGALVRMGGLWRRLLACCPNGTPHGLKTLARRSAR